MRKRVTMSVTLICLFAWLAPATSAYAQSNQVSERLLTLEKTVEELRAQTVQVPTLAEAVQALGESVAELRRAVDESARRQASLPDAQDRLDELQTRVAELERELANTRADLADTSQLAVAEPSAWSSGSGTGSGVSYDDRFHWTTSDGRFAVGLTGFLHAAYQLELAGNEGESAVVDRAGLLVRRARVGFLGHVGSPRMTYELTLSAIQDVPLFDYYLDYAFRPWLRVRAGQYKTPFTRHFIASSTRRAFLDAPIAVDTLQYERDIQAGVHGLLADERVSYYVGVGNGAGRNIGNDNVEVNAILRADVVALGERFEYGEGDIARTDTPSLMFGVGAIHDLVAMPGQIGDLVLNNDVDGNGEIDNVRAVSASVDGVFRYKGLEVALEAVIRNETFGTILQHSGNVELFVALGLREDHFYGNFYGQVSYVLPTAIRSHRLLLGTRVGSARIPFLGVGGRASSLPRGDRALELDGLVQLYAPSGYRLLGLMYGMRNFSPIEGVEGTGGSVHRLILETQLKF